MSTMRIRILRSSNIVFYPLFYCTLLVCVLCTSCPGYAVTAPSREVVVVKTPENLEKPPWKQVWDEAREFFRQGKLPQASRKYDTLLKMKPNIEEAKWEYCKVLIEIEDWLNAAILLEGLIESDPNRIDYLIHAGKVALEKKAYLHAVKYYGQVYEQDPFGGFSTTALKGLISGLEGLGKKRNAYLMMEQMYQRNSSDPELLHKLAILSQELGMLGQARFYYGNLVDHYSVDDATLLQAARIHETGEKSEKRTYYWEKYLQRQPDYLPFRKKAANYYLEIGKRRMALPHLLMILEREGGDEEILLKIGRIYLHDERRPDKALYYLEEHRKKYPGDEKIDEEISQIQTVLANDFLSIVENDGAWRLWRDLAKITPNRKAIYLKMAELLESLMRDEELLEVLEIVHRQNPEDYQMTFRIAQLYRKNEDYKNTRRYLNQLEDFKAQVPEYLLVLAEINLQQGDEKGALSSYLQYLGQVPEDKKIKSKSLRLAGQLGLIHELKTAFGKGGVNLSTDSYFSKIDSLYLEGLRENGLFRDAQLYYDKLLETIPEKSTAGTKIRFHKAESIFQRGRVYEAEQIVRQILADNLAVVAALEKLTEIAIYDQQLAWAKSWFNLLSEKLGVDFESNNYREWPQDLFHLKVNILDAEGSYKEAVKILKKYLTDTRREKEWSGRQQLEVYMSLIRLHYKYGEYEKCKSLVERVDKKYPNNIELIVISDQLDRINSNDSFVVSSTDELNAQKKSFSRTLKRASLEYEYGALRVGNRFVSKALESNPTSVNGRMLRSKILTAMGNYSEALEIVKALHQEFPDEEYFELQELQIEYKRGNFSQIVKDLPLSKTKAEEDSSLQASKNSKEHYFWKRLILARSLWADKQWEAAITVYDSLLDSPVKSIFLKKMEVENFNFHLPPIKRTLWNVLTFTHPNQPDPIATVMRPSFVASNIGNPIDHISAGLYEKYRWQKLIESELSVRKSMKRRNYHQVEKEYRALLKRGGAKDTLFDLAEVYGRLGLYGKEAQLYQEIQKQGQDYPELGELVRLNKLKRKPRVSIGYDYSSERGRGGYIDMKKKSGGFEGWIMPTLSQELNLSYHRNNYSSSDSSKTISSNRFWGSYTSNFEDKVDLNMSFGAEDLSDNGGDTILYNIEFLGRIDDIVQGHISFNQDIVDDTVKAVEDGIHFRNLEAGVTVDVVPRWFCGVDYRYREYSDDNRQDMYRLWTSYNVFGEANLLRIKYAYENSHNGTENIGIYDATSYDPPYWSPDKYWKHLVMFHFKHMFTPAYSEEKTSSHYTVDYSFGYESGDHVVQYTSFNIFLEMNRHFLLKGNFTYESANDYRGSDVALSLIYRW